MCGVKLIPEDEGIINSPNQNKGKKLIIRCIRFSLALIPYKVLDLFKITSFGKDFVQQWKIISVSFQSRESFAMRRSSSINHMNTNMMRSHVRDEIRSTRSLVEPLAGARPHEDSITAKTISPSLSSLFLVRRH
ncbi:hypothetical protein F2Q70_00039606 [Brassica cretica]|uniref:Uncharacterized protein n=1 Tax=Brassica cretica TaxID=69181 RepID=A0A8S9K2W4_BRACR|nr:hypothetical protein F2Q70_00039606 [Brassica cretica]